MAGKPRQDREVATVFSPCLSGVVSAVFVFHARRCVGRPPRFASGCFLCPAAFLFGRPLCLAQSVFAGLKEAPLTAAPRSLHQDRRSPESRRCGSRVAGRGRRVRGSGKGAPSGSVGLGRKGAVSPHHTTRPASPRDLPAGMGDRQGSAGGWAGAPQSGRFICLRRRRALRWRRSHRRRARRAPRGGCSGRSPGRRRGPAARCCCCRRCRGPRACPSSDRRC